MPPGLCPDIAAFGACTTPDCQYRHSTYACDLCSVFCISAAQLNQHNQGKKHKQNLAGGPAASKRCLICDVVVSGGESVMKIHEKGRRHQAGIKDYAEAGLPIPEMEDERVRNAVRCTLCSKDIPASTWTRHLVSPIHKRKERYQAYKVALEESEKDKYGVVVEEGRLDFGIIEVDSLPEQPTRAMKMHLRLDEVGTICLTEARISSGVGAYAALRQVNFTVRLTKPFHLKYGTTYLLQVTFDPQGNRGRYDDRLELVFADPVTLHRFVIARPIQAIVGVKADQELLKATAPYVRPAPRPREPELQVVDGVPPPALAKIIWDPRIQLPFADIPAYVWAALDQQSKADTIRRIQNTLLPRFLSSTTYAKHWKILLWLDEIQATKDIATYDMNNRPFAAINGKYHFLEVPGLAEKRPSVIVGDKIIVRPVGRVSNNSGDGRWFAGYVHRVEQVQVALVFNPSFHAIRNQHFDIRFRLNRTPIRRMHQALETSCLEPRLLFPTPQIVQTLRMKKPSTGDMAGLAPFDRKIAQNAPQWLAVGAIAKLRPGAVPFVVFGPPGTGKTVTIIEGMRQILDSSPSARILACAPSNSAADILADRLRLSGALSRTELFRMNAPSRPKDSLPMALRDFSLMNNEDTFSIPPMATLMRYRVVVSTCLSASVPYGIGFPRGHFTHVFIDEAGQAMEPEAMIPIKTAAGPNTSVILSGDPMQLGPIVRSAIAQKLGLGTSYLDRLMSLPAYEPTQYSGVTVVKLIKNWRSHPAILRFPNEEFYKGELEPHADEVITHSCLRWDMLPSDKFPIMFHAIKGKDERQASSPSFFNVDEASAVRSYVNNLKGDRRLRLTDQDIGVISPYNAQCQKIRTAMRNQHPNIKVGSVEEFQGQERRVIIISTVRSSMDYVSYDVRHTLGFVSHPRRFNVAITRAQALVIVVGDPDVLGLDLLWRCFLNYIYLEGGWIGRRIAWDAHEIDDRGPMGPSERATVAGEEAGTDYGAQRRNEMETEMDELVGRVRAMVLSQVPADEDDAEDVTGGAERMEANADRPWREVE